MFNPNRYPPLLLLLSSATCPVASLRAGTVGPSPPSMERYMASRPMPSLFFALPQRQVPIRTDTMSSDAVICAHCCDPPLTYSLLDPHPPYKQTRLWSSNQRTAGHSRGSISGWEGLYAGQATYTACLATRRRC